jgi:hypothetical protein
VALSGCTHSSSAFNAPWIDSKQEVAAVTEQWATAFSKGDVDALTSMYSQDAVIWGISSSSMRTDPSAIREYYARLLKTFPGTRATVREMNIRVYGDSAGIRSIDDPPRLARRRLKRNTDALDGVRETHRKVADR